MNEIYALSVSLSKEDISRFRKTNSLSRKELSILLGVSVRTIEKWETSEEGVSGPLVFLLTLLNSRPELIDKYRLPEKRYPLRLYYMSGNMVSTVIDVDMMNRKVSFKNYTDKLILRAFGNREEVTYEEYEEFLESRCFPKTRDKLVDRLMLFFTGNTRDSRAILSKQSQSIEEKRKNLDELVRTVDKVYERLSVGDIDCIGEELDRTWQIKKDLAGGISNPDIDNMYNTARNAGAIGGKILDAGGGGFMLLYVPDEKKESVRSAMKAYREVPFRVDYQGSRIIFAD